MRDQTPSDIEYRQWIAHLEASNTFSRRDKEMALHTHTGMSCQQPDNPDDECGVRTLLGNVPELKGKLLWGGRVEREIWREANE